MGWIELETGAKVFIDTATKKGVCKSCKTEFLWGVTKNKKWIPIVQVNGKWISHFANCPGAGEHRKGKA
jgi:hypothetical protein